MALAVAVPAAAEDKAAARAAYAEGSKYYDLNQYALALEAFKRAYWNYEDPVILFNIAQCHRALGHKAEAVGFYRSYLRKASEPRNREEVQKLVSELESAIAQEKAVAAAPPQGTIAAAGSGGLGAKTESAGCESRAFTGRRSAREDGAETSLEARVGLGCRRWRAR